MFKRDEASRLKHEFWTTFGRYMRPVPSAEGTKINWVNYHTGVKHLYFRMDSEAKAAMISISIEHRDALFRELYFQQFQQFEQILHATLGETWHWQQHVPVEGTRLISRISKELPGASVFDKNDWPELISFFKPRIIALDNFWSDARFSFETLG